MTSWERSGEQGRGFQPTWPDTPSVLLPGTHQRHSVPITSEHLSGHSSTLSQRRSSGVSWALHVHKRAQALLTRLFREESSPCLRRWGLNWPKQPPKWSSTSHNITNLLKKYCSKTEPSSHPITKQQPAARPSSHSHTLKMHLDRHLLQQLGNPHATWASLLVSWLRCRWDPASCGRPRTRLSAAPGRPGRRAPAPVCPDPAVQGITEINQHTLSISLSLSLTHYHIHIAFQINLYKIFKLLIIIKNVTND